MLRMPIDQKEKVNNGLLLDSTFESFNQDNCRHTTANIFI